MKILFDQGTPVPLRQSLVPHDVDTAAELGWSELENGDLLREAESKSYDILITTDQNLQYQQNLTGRTIAIVVLRTTAWPVIRLHLDKISKRVDVLKSGDYVEISF